MKLLQQLDLLVRMGLEIKVKKVKAVRDGRDVSLVAVEVGDMTGEGDSPATAITDAISKLQVRLKARHDSDAALLTVLEAPVEIDPSLPLGE